MVIERHLVIQALAKRYKMHDDAAIDARSKMAHYLSIDDKINYKYQFNREVAAIYARSSILGVAEDLGINDILGK